MSGLGNGGRGAQCSSGGPGRGTVNTLPHLLGHQFPGSAGPPHWPGPGPQTRVLPHWEAGPTGPFAGTGSSAPGAPWAHTGCEGKWPSGKHTSLGAPSAVAARVVWDRWTMSSPSCHEGMPQVAPPAADTGSSWLSRDAWPPACRSCSDGAYVAQQWPWCSGPCTWGGTLRPGEGGGPGSFQR